MINLMCTTINRSISFSEFSLASEVLYALVIM